MYTTVYVYMIKINEPQLPWLQIGKYHTGLDVKMEVTHVHVYAYVYMYMYVLGPSVAEFVFCVLGRGGGESGEGGEGERSGRGEKEEGRSGLRDLIIQRIDHPSDDVS